MGAILSYSNIAGGVPAAPYGGRTVIINNIAWRATNWKPELNTRKIRRNDVNGDEAEKMIRSEPTNQSGLTLQVPLASTPQPTPCGTFVVDGATYVITKSAIAQPEGEFWTADIDYESA